MIGKFIEFFVHGWRIARTREQFLFTLALLVIIPVCFLWSGQQFLSVAQQSSERAERARIGLLHDSIAALYQATEDTAVIRRMSANIGDLNHDISLLALVTVAPDGSLESDVLFGDQFDASQFKDFFRAASVRTDESLVFESYENGDRHWLGVRTLTSSSTKGALYVVSDISMRDADALFASEVRYTYFYLALIIILLMVIISRHARIINYALLYTELKQALDAKTTFINMTAHELRAPLTALRGYASMIREDGRVPDSAREFAVRTEESAEYLIRLVSDLLDVAKMQSGGMKLALNDVSVNGVASKVVERLAPLARQHQIEFSLEPATDDMTIHVDPTRLEEIFINLVSNALKYTNEGKVVISAEKVRGKCELRIKDTGVGMSAEDREKLFSPYFRSSEVEGGKVVGTGLGLWITKQFIEAMKGTISVESIHGVGTHIVVTFPIVA